MEAIRRVAFFGSPEFAIPTLDALSRSPYRPELVVSQPNRPAGRGRHEEAPPVAVWARRRGIEVWQPEKVRDPAFLTAFAERGFDLAVVVAFGQIFPKALLAMPRVGCMNLHASLLPRHRGAAPIQAAIAAGDAVTGVTTMQMEAGLDTGPILLQRSTPIGEREDTPSLSARLAVLGAELVVETIAGLERGEIEPRPQDDAQATLAPRLEKRDGIVDWTLEAAVLERRSRAYRPWPGLVTLCRGEPLKLHEVRVEQSGGGGCSRVALPGTFLGVSEGALVVACGAGTSLGLLRVQRPGRRVIAGDELARAERLAPGELAFTPAPVEAARDA